MDKPTVPARRNRDIERFDRWAPAYDQSVLQRWYFVPIHARMLDLVTPELAEPPRSILDVGCGTGRLLRAAAGRWPGAQLLGVDPAEGMVREATRLVPNAAFRLAPAESLPFPDRVADLVLTSLSFHHWSDQARGVREMARVLRPGGILCLADHRFVVAQWFGAKVKSRNQIRALITAAGISVRRQEGMGTRFVLITIAQK